MNQKTTAADAHQRETFPGFLATPTVDLSDGLQTAQLGFKTTGLDVFFADGQNLHFDLAGRLLRVATPNVQWRRGLSGRVLELRKRSREAGGGFARRKLSAEDASQLIDRANARMRELLDAFQAGRVQFPKGPIQQPSVRLDLDRVLASAAQFSSQTASQDVARFREIYGDVPILPPDQYGALVLMSTEGCRYNQCTFCSFYRGTRYREKPVAEFRQHVRQAVEYHGGGLALRRGVFLGQANALMGDPVWREEILRTVNQELELPAAEDAKPPARWWQGFPRRFIGVSSFLDAFSGAGIGRHEFARLRALNLRHVFIGMETGDAELLKWLRKPATCDQLRDTVQAAKLGGVGVGVIVLLGVGGERFFQRHVQQSLDLIDAMPLDRGDFVYLSPLVATNPADDACHAKQDHIEPLCLARIRQQEASFRAGLQRIKQTRGVYVARYDVQHFIY